MTNCKVLDIFLRKRHFAGMSYLKAFCFCIVTLIVSLSFQSSASDEIGSFTLVAAENQTEITFSDTKGNYVFGKQYDNYLWIRFAASSEKDGETSDHLDIDIWNFSGPGVYTAANPRDNKREGKKWNIWWHKGDQVYVNEANSSPCTLILKKKGKMLMGSFACEGLRLNNGTESLDVKNGNFRVIPVNGSSK